MKVFAIIPAAGQGRRFGSRKQFQELAGLPLLLHTLKPFNSCSLIDAVCLMVPSGEEESTRDLVHSHGIKKVQWVLAGGEERQGSVARGLEKIPPCDLVVVHDGVRPFVTASLLEETVRVAAEIGACVTGLPQKETMKRIDEKGTVLHTVDRDELWSIQTPQTFRYSLLREAMEKAKKENFIGTDEAMLVERLGAPIKMIRGLERNIKITSPEDLELAEAILKIGELR